MVWLSPINSPMSTIEQINAENLILRENEQLKQQLANVSAELQVMTRWHRYVRAKLDEIDPEAYKTIKNYYP